MKGVVLYDKKSVFIFKKISYDATYRSKFKNLIYLTENFSFCCALVVSVQKYQGIFMPKIEMGGSKIEGKIN